MAVVIPCYNVADQVEGVVRSIPPVVRTVVVVDDASSDGTAEVLRRLTDPRLVRVFHDRNQGVGGAMISGYSAALERQAAVCVKMDGDGQMSADDLPALIGPVLDGQADYAKGNRFRHLDALRRMPRVRMIGNGMLSFLTKLVSGYWSVLDPTNGYTAVRSEVLRRLDLSRLARRYFFESSMLVELNILGASVQDVDMPARYHGERSSLRLHTVALQFPFLLLRALLRRFFWRYVMQDFNALTICVLAGVPAVAFGTVFGAYHWWRSVASGVPATAGTTLLAALPIILGVQCLLVALVLDILYQPERRRLPDREVFSSPGSEPGEHGELDSDGAHHDQEREGVPRGPRGRSAAGERQAPRPRTWVPSPTRALRGPHGPGE